MSTANSLQERKPNAKQVALVQAEGSTTGLSKTIKKNILDEESFIKDLETIIERDFFPDLEKLRVQREYLQAVKSNDRVKLYELYSKYSIQRMDTNPVSSKQTKGYESPATFETPEIRQRDGPKNDNKSPERPFANEEPPVKKMASDDSLDKYLARNTSEDNLSFETIMDEAERRDRSKLHRAWLYEQERRIKQFQDANLALPNIEQQMLESNTGSVDTWAFKVKNSLMYPPEGAELTFDEKLELKKKTRLIKHENTRFEKIPFDLNVSSAASGKKFGQLNAKLGIDGKELAESETPKVNGYGFVAGMPSPMPGQTAGDESPMMTWGEIEGTPFRLDVSNTPYTLHGGSGPEFKIPDVPEREKIAMNLEEKASAARRKRKMEALKCVQRNLTHNSPNRSIDSPNASLTDRINIMSPAAQRLLSSKLNIRPNSGKSVSSSRDNTPIQSPLSSPLASPLSTRKANFKSPIVNNKNSTMHNLKANLKRAPLDLPSNDITDDLLKLPK